MSTAAATERRIRATINGLVQADGLTWTAWWHRMTKLPPRRAVRLGQAWDHARSEGATSLPTPYLQSSSPELVDPSGPTDDSEWFVVGLRSCLAQTLDGESGSVWAQLAEMRAADPSSVHGRIGTQIALANIAAGSGTPASGNDNPHYFDDHAMVRSVAAGLLRPGMLEEAARLAEEDAAVTHALDGVWGARAMAVLVSALVDGMSPQEAVGQARAQLPGGSWISNVVRECLEVGHAGSPLGLAAALEREVVDHVYAYSNQAPETLGLLLAHLLQSGSAEALVLGAFGHPRHADALVPLAAAVAGASFPEDGDAGAAELGGVCIGALQGLAVSAVADLTVREAAESMA